MEQHIDEEEGVEKDRCSAGRGRVCCTARTGQWKASEVEWAGGRAGARSARMQDQGTPARPTQTIIDGQPQQQQQQQQQQEQQQQQQQQQEQQQQEEQQHQQTYNNSSY